MNFLNNRIPPPLIALVFGGLMYALALDGARANTPLLLAAVFTLWLAGTAVAVAGTMQFRRHRTTVNPLKPASSSALVRSGIYRFTRNPMYLGMALLLLAWACYLQSLLALLGVAGFMAYIQHFQIRPEERALAALFGEAFGEYCAQVRRWL